MLAKYLVLMIIIDFNFLIVRELKNCLLRFPQTLNIKELQVLFFFKNLKEVVIFMKELVRNGWFPR